MILCLKHIIIFSWTLTDLTDLSFQMPLESCESFWLSSWPHSWGQTISVKTCRVHTKSTELNSDLYFLFQIQLAIAIKIISICLGLTHPVLPEREPQTYHRGLQTGVYCISPWSQLWWTLQVSPLDPYGWWESGTACRWGGTDPRSTLWSWRSRTVTERCHNPNRCTDNLTRLCQKWLGLTHLSRS